MTALVVGGTGFIGPRLIKKLVEQGEQVACMDLNPSTDLLSGWENEVEIIRGGRDPIRRRNAGGDRD